jgi:hypothetical protein
MANSTVSQIFNNGQSMAQQGDGVVAQETVNFAGGDALLGFSGSGWTQTAGPISLTVWLDGQPLGGGLSIYANSTAMHMSLGRSWVHAPGVTPGQHQVMVVAGATTITDQNDRISLTLVELGDGLALRATSDTPCPVGSSQIVAKEQFEIQNGAFMLSASGSGWAAQAGAMLGMAMLLDGGNPLVGQVFANNDSQHLATVPVDLVYTNLQNQRGSYQMALQSVQTWTDDNDIAHMTALEWIDAAQAPIAQDMNPYLQDYTAAAQEGGDYIAQSTFQCNGGPLLFRVSLSGWCPEPNTMIGATVEINGNPVTSTELFANPANTHLTMVSNDVVIEGVPAGTHGFELQAGASTYTDQNDRVGVMLLEFPA